MPVGLDDDCFRRGIAGRDLAACIAALSDVPVAGCRQALMLSRRPVIGHVISRLWRVARIFWYWQDP